MTILQHDLYGYQDLSSLMSMMTGDEKHSASATSTLDVLWVLYDRVLRIDPRLPDNPDRDRFLLSKGHGPMAYYAVLAAKGFFPVADLGTFGSPNSRFGNHPDATLLPGVEISSGSLGHGLPIAVGLTLGLRAAVSRPPQVFVLVGDGELDEGSNHEAIQVAGRLQLDGLTAIVIDNASASLRWPDGIAARFSTEGWRTRTVDGHDHHAIEMALQPGDDGGPRAVIAKVTPKEIN